MALRAFGYLASFYAGFGLYVAGLFPVWLFMILGFLALIRFFDATHDEFHTRQNDHPFWHLLRRVFAVNGPLQLGYAEILKSHRLHHAAEGSPKDPDRWIMDADWGLLLFHCATEPEQAVFRYIKKHGFERRLVVDLTTHFAVWIGLAILCSGPRFVVYNLVTRLSNGVAWLIFSNVLHRRENYRGFEPLPIPGWLRSIWIVLLGRNNFNASTHHFLHHAYEFVPSLDLPALSARIRGFSRDGAALGTSPPLPQEG